MGTRSPFVLAAISLTLVGCATLPDSSAHSTTAVAGEWLGTATVGPTIRCCKGAAGPVRLLLEQKGAAVSGTLVGVGYRGRVGGTVTATELTGSCDCQSSNVATNLQIEGAISGSNMVFRLGDSRMTLSRMP